MPDILSSWDSLKYELRKGASMLRYGDVEYTVLQRIGRRKRSHNSVLMFTTEWIKIFGRGEGFIPGCG